MEKAVEVVGLGKKYSLGEREKYLALRDIFVKAVKVPFNLLRGKKFRKKGEFWALKDINFTVNKGEVLGIIGKNGAGKSTILKILSRITEPTEGLITMHGRVSSLLEVGTGFHPELTGRENIYLNGALLGHPQNEIKTHLPEILEFAQVEGYIDAPLRTYSSGMVARLGFAVATSWVPEILILDEVLAVGDEEFKKKCYARMSGFRLQGTTILLVSHSMETVRDLCSRAVWLEKGGVMAIGKVDEVIRAYRSNMQSG